MTESVRIVYRSKPVQVPLLGAIAASGGWREGGVEVASAEYVSGAERSDAMLLAGECDVVFGSHISPYVQRYRGRPFVYLAQTVNWVDDVLVARDELADARGLEGRRLSEEPGVAAGAHAGSHPGGNHLLYLKRAGVDLERVTFVASERRRRYLDVADGVADAAFAPSRDAARAEALGLRVLRLPPLPMVHGTTLTTLWPTVERREALCAGLVKAVVMGIHFAKTQPERMWEIMRSQRQGELSEEDEASLRSLLAHNQQLLEARPYPTLEAIANAFALAVIQEPDLEGRLNPLALWHTRFVTELDQSGWIARLYGGEVPGPGSVPRPLGAARGVIV